MPRRPRKPRFFSSVRQAREKKQNAVNNLHLLEKILRELQDARRQSKPIGFGFYSREGQVNFKIPGKETMPISKLINQLREESIEEARKAHEEIPAARIRRTKGLIGLTRRILAGPRTNYRLRRAKRSAKKNARK